MLSVQKCKDGMCRGLQSIRGTKEEEGGKERQHDALSGTRKTEVKTFILI